MKSRAKPGSALSCLGVIALFLTLCNTAAWAGTEPSSSAGAAPASETNGPSPNKTVLVHPKLGGFILGYDIDQNGTEGLLSEYVTLQDGNNDVATEVFDQKTGKILKVIAEKSRWSDRRQTDSCRP